MDTRILKDSALPPPEVKRVISEYHIPKSCIDGWYAIPTLYPPKLRIGRDEIANNGLVDAYQLLQPLLGNKTLTRTLRTIDVLNGCGHHCDTCIADAAFPSRMFSFESLKRLFEDRRFLLMLQPDSLRFGSSGDILDHPDAIRILKMVIKTTKFLDERLRTSTKGKKRHRIVVFTNYRPNLEGVLDELISLALNNKSRVRLVLSLPFNSSDTINERFTKFAKARPNIFGKRNQNHADGMINFGFGELIPRNIGVQDVRHPYFLFTSGRVLTRKTILSKIPKYDVLEADRELQYRDRGLVKTYLNPDALWLMIYSTMVESHTTRVFTPINTKNLDGFSHLSWHSDFPQPPNWPGKITAERSWGHTSKLRKIVQRFGKINRRVTVVKK